MTTTTTHPAVRVAFNFDGMRRRVQNSTDADDREPTYRRYRRDSLLKRADDVKDDWHVEETATQWQYELNNGFHHAGGMPISVVADRTGLTVDPGDTHVAIVADRAHDLARAAYGKEWTRYIEITVVPDMLARAVVAAAAASTTLDWMPDNCLCGAWWQSWSNDKQRHLNEGTCWKCGHGPAHEAAKGTPGGLRSRSAECRHDHTATGYDDPYPT